MDAHEALATGRGAYDEARARVGEHEEELKVLRARLEADSTRINQLTLRERELAMNMEHLLDHAGERHRVDLRRVLGDYHMRDLPDASLKQRIEELMRLIERMGEINLTAIEEYEEKSQRYEYLTGQRADLEDALTQLERAIRQMNRESRRLFKEAFDAVSARFTRVFPTMFGGGRAELRLTNPEDLLESGIDIIAQPPGKKLGSLELMSGGEKALTAVSLIFAIFQYRPSPFCLLDEVDAPLDEANIGRFSDAVRQMTDRSQFILITHAKRTMEAADVLYGVTMEQPGVSKLVAVELTQSRQRPVEGDDAQVAVA
jgi:chromosome segregation protein